MGIIYKITNDINNKIYIGKTVTSLSERWSKHLYAAKTEKTHLYNAMRKYGFEHFNISIVEDNIPDELLNEKEIYYIQNFDTIKNGYNQTIGGDGRKWINREEVKNFYEQGKSVREIAEELDVWYSSIVDVLKELNIYNKEEAINRGIITSSLKQSDKKVLQYTEDLILLKEFGSLKEASESTGFNKGSIKTACENKTGYKGYFWVREGDELPSARKIKQCFSHKI